MFLRSKWYEYTMSTTKYYKISKAAEKLGVSIPALRKWEADGVISAIRTPGGQRMLDISSLCPDTIVKHQSKQSPLIIVYARVSSTKQKDDLARQKTYLFDHPTVKKARSEDVIAITDVGSGLNFKRTGLLRILGLVKEGGISKVIVASRDRMARFGFELIEWLCNGYGTEILVLDQEDSTPEEELGKDLMSIVQVYCCRWNGRRRYKNAGKKPSSETETNVSSGGDVEPVGGVLSLHVQQGNCSVDHEDQHSQESHSSSEQTGHQEDKGEVGDKQFLERKAMVGKLSDCGKKESRKRGKK